MKRSKLNHGASILYGCAAMINAQNKDEALSALLSLPQLLQISPLDLSMQSSVLDTSRHRYAPRVPSGLHQ